MRIYIGQRLMRWLWRRAIFAPMLRLMAVICGSTRPIFLCARARVRRRLRRFGCSRRVRLLWVWRFWRHIRLRAIRCFSMVLLRRRVRLFGDNSLLAVGIIALILMRIRASVGIFGAMSSGVMWIRVAAAIARRLTTIIRRVRCSC